MSKTRTGEDLEAQIWHTIDRLTKGEIAPDAANAFSRLAKEVTRSKLARTAVLAKAGRPVPQSIIDYAESKATDTNSVPTLSALSDAMETLRARDAAGLERLQRG